MFKLFLLTVTIGGFVFAGSWGNVPESVEASNQNDNQYSFAEDTSIDDFKVEAGRRRGGKGNRGKRRGGGGLR